MTVGIAEMTHPFVAAREAFVSAGLPVFPSLGAAARAISRTVAWSQASARA